jgi:hypothetical protein
MNLAALRPRGAEDFSSLNKSVCTWHHREFRRGRKGKRSGHGCDYYVANCLD